MKIPIYQVDAFTSRVFGGNPAAVCPLESWLDDATLQSIAAENNLSETAYFIGRDGRYEIRWMTPTAEVDLCGHATLASAWVVMNRLDRGRERVVFGSRSGPLTVVREGDLLSLDFPARPPEPGGSAPAVGEVAALDRHAVIASAPGKTCDFVSRFFAPAWGVPEDPVTGSSHCTLVPYWAGRLGRSRLRALQVSPRGGELFCEAQGARVAIGGRAVPFMEGLIEIS